MLARLGTLALVLTLAGCDSLARGDYADSGVAFDGAAAPIDAGGPPAYPPELGDLCYDGIDNDGDGATDCNESECTADPVCCVGSGAGECCEPEGTTLELPLECADEAASECFADAPSFQVFGQVPPAIELGALVPQGGSTDGGVVLGDAIDPRGANIAMLATIVTPESRCTDCSDAAGIGLIDRLPAAGEHALVLFGVLAIGSRDEVTVIVADEVVARVSLPTGSAQYAIEIDVNGHARALVGGDPIAEVASLALPASARAAVFGRTDNRPAGVGAMSVAEASVTLRRCDAPAALERRQTPIVPWSESTWTPREVRRPTVVTWNDGTTTKRLMAFASEGAIYLARRTAAGEYRNDPVDPGPPALALPAELVSARDPWLTVQDGRFLLYFVGVAEDGATRVWRAASNPSYDATFGPPEMVLDPMESGIDGIGSPAVVPPDPSSAEPHWTLLARALVGGSSRIVRWTSVNGQYWALYGNSLESATLRVPQTNDLFAFDRDEVAAPAPIAAPDQQGRVIERLYYAGRRGTRWSIGALVSSDGVHFLPIGPVLDAGSGFDALGVADPAPVLEDGVLQLYYAGTDGNTWKVGIAGPAGTLGE